MGLSHWRNMVRVLLLGTGVYLWHGGHLGPPLCTFEKVAEFESKDGYQHVVVAALGTPTSRNLRKEIEKFARLYADAEKLRIEVLNATPGAVSEAIRSGDNAYMLHHRVVVYERLQEDELFIDTHRVDREQRAPVLQLAAEKPTLHREVLT